MSYLASGITGAAPIFNDIMSYVLRNQEPSWQEKPADVMKGTVCPSGLPRELTVTSTESENEEKSEEKGCTETNEELYWAEGKPSRSTIISKEVWIKPETGLPPEYGEEAEGLVLETHMIYQDPVTELYCGDCNRAVDEEGKIIYEKHYAQENMSLPASSTPQNNGQGKDKKEKD